MYVIFCILCSQGANSYNAIVSNASNRSSNSTPLVTLGANEYFPQPSFISFDQVNSAPIIKKLRELQEKLIAEGQRNEALIDKNNIELIEHLMNDFGNLEQASQFNDQLELVFQLIDLWPKGF